MREILNAESEEEISACFPVLHALRPHLVEGEFVERVRQQQSQGYHLRYLRDSRGVVAAAGFRILDFLAWGRVLYVDDLVTLPEARQSGCGGALMDWLIAHAREQRCDELHLDSGFPRHAAHRLYLKHGLQISCLHFSTKLNPNPRPA